MVGKTSHASSSQTRAMVHVPRVSRREKVEPVRVVARTMNSAWQARQADGRRAEQYRDIGGAYGFEVPAVVFDVLR